MKQLFSRSVALAVLLTLWNFATSANAHPTGNISIDRYARLEAGSDQIEILYKLDYAEIPAAIELGEIDAVNGRVPEEAKLSYLGKKAAEVHGNLSLKVNGKPVELEVVPRDLRIRPGEAELKTLQLTFDLTADLPPGEGATWRVEYSDHNYPGRTGWKEIVVVPGPGTRLDNSNASSREVSQGLTNFPTGSDVVSPQQTTAIFEIVPTTGVASTATLETPPSVGSTPASSTTHTPRNAPTQAFVSKELTTEVMLLGLIIAFALGGLYALSPGYGKALMATYLVGSSGTPKHAVLLGLAVTIRHTLGLFVLGLATLFASKYILPERLYPVLSTLSGLALSGIGIWLLASYLRQLSQQHQHNHNYSFTRQAAEGSMTPRTLLMLSVSGGIMSCPWALVVLLSTIALRQLAYGLLLISAFSIGLASVLIVLGLITVSARTVDKSRPPVLK